MLNPDLGEITRGDRGDWLTTRAGAVGHALYGPFVDLEPGRYAVAFEVELAEPVPDGDPVCATVDVVTGGRVDIAFDYLRGSDLRSGKPIVL